MWNLEVCNLEVNTALTGHRTHASIVMCSHTGSDIHIHIHTYLWVVIMFTQVSTGFKGAMAMQ